MRHMIIASKSNGPMIRPVEVRSAGPWRLWLKFEDGTEGEVDISDLRDQPQFASLQDPDIFQYVYIHPLRRTICWDNERIELAHCGFREAVISGR